MEKSALLQLIQFCVYDDKYNNKKKYYESIGRIISIENVSKTYVKLRTKKGDVDCLKQEKMLELTGELNNTSLRKEVRNNYDLVQFLQNYQDGFFSKAKGLVNGKQKLNLFKGLNSLYKILPYEPGNVLIKEGITLSYQIPINNSSHPLDIRLLLKPNTNGPNSIISYNIFDGHLFDKITSHEPLSPDYEKISSLNPNVRKHYEFTSKNVKKIIEYVLFNYHKILEEEIYESYLATKSIDRLNNIKNNNS